MLDGGKRARTRGVELIVINITFFLFLLDNFFGGSVRREVRMKGRRRVGKERNGTKIYTKRRVRVCWSELGRLITWWPHG